MHTERASIHFAFSFPCATSVNLRFVKETIERVKKIGFKGPVNVGGKAFNIEPLLKDYAGSDYYG